MNKNVFFKIEESKQQPTGKDGLAEVVEVTANGVKIKLPQETNPTDTYYKRINDVAIGDVVYWVKVSGTILIIGTIK